MRITEKLFSPKAGDSAPCVMSFGLPCLRHRLSGFMMMQSGHPRFAFVALLLLAFPDVFTFHVLFALPRFAERNRQFWAYSLHPYLNFAEYRFRSASLHARISFLVSMARPDQWMTRFVAK